MTYSATDAAGSALPAGVDISFRDGLTAEQQEVATRSVATLVTRAVQARERLRAAQAARARLAHAINAPIAKLIKADPQAAQALEELDALSPDDLDVVAGLPANAARATRDDSVTIEQASNLDAVDLTAPPYDFAWRWHHPAGAPPISSFTHADGQLGIDARSGSISSGASKFVEAHAGFGLVLSTPHQVNVTGHSLRDIWYGYSVGCTGVGGDATSEGGMEFTALENGQFLKAASHKMWRRRVSGLESVSFSLEGFYPVHDPSELAFTMFPNRAYTFNVGIWALADRSPGAGVAWAQARIEGEIWLMTIQRGG